MDDILAEAPPGPVLVSDTETGGFSSTNNPLLSLGFVCADEKEEFGKREIRFAPPENTWLEVPVLADQLKGKFDKTIDHWLNLSTGETQKPAEEKPTYFITANAVETNGFVGSSETIPGWDMTKAREWMEGGFSYAGGAESIAAWLDQLTVKPKVNVCHHAAFDMKFIKDWLPELNSVLPNVWACTQQAYMNKFLNGKKKGSSLAAICKVAGYTANSEQKVFDFHRALGDCEATLYIWRWLRGQ